MAIDANGKTIDHVIYDGSAMDLVYYNNTLYGARPFKKDHVASINILEGKHGQTNGTGKKTIYQTNSELYYYQDELLATLYPVVGYGSDDSRLTNDHLSRHTVIGNNTGYDLKVISREANKNSTVAFAGNPIAMKITSFNCNYSASFNNFSQSVSMSGTGTSTPIPGYFRPAAKMTIINAEPYEEREPPSVQEGTASGDSMTGGNDKVKTVNYSYTPPSGIYSYDFVSKVELKLFSLGYYGNINHTDDTTKLLASYNVRTFTTPTMPYEFDLDTTTAYAAKCNITRGPVAQSINITSGGDTLLLDERGPRNGILNVYPADHVNVEISPQIGYERVNKTYGIYPNEEGPNITIKTNPGPLYLKVAFDPHIQHMHVKITRSSISKGLGLGNIDADYVGENTYTLYYGDTYYFLGSAIWPYQNTGAIEGSGSSGGSKTITIASTRPNRQLKIINNNTQQCEVLLGDNDDSSSALPRQLINGKTTRTLVVPQGAYYQIRLPQVMRDKSKASIQGSIPQASLTTKTYEDRSQGFATALRFKQGVGTKGYKMDANGGTSYGNPKYFGPGNEIDEEMFSFGSGPKVETIPMTGYTAKVYSGWNFSVLDSISTTIQAPTTNTIDQYTASNNYYKFETTFVNPNSSPMNLTINEAYIDSSSGTTISDAGSRDEYDYGESTFTIPAGGSYKLHMWHYLGDIFSELYISYTGTCSGKTGTNEIGHNEF